MTLPGLVGRFGAILADPPWTFRVYSGKGKARSAERHYDTLSIDDIAALPVSAHAAPDCALFLWVSWPLLIEAIAVINAWGFSFRTCAFDWTKANAGQLDMFRDDLDGRVGMGYWTRSNSEPCLLATRGNPERLARDVRMAIIEPRREHSRKPDCVRERIERLVAGPYLELFARSGRPGWTAWGNEADKFGLTG
jgi:N6-adenosine-specific RNA methylase IME4